MPEFNFDIWQIVLSASVGLVIFYLIAAFRFVPKPWKWIVEVNLPWKPTIVMVWDSGLHLLLIPSYPFMRIVEKLYCADQSIIITIGKDDGEPGGSELVEFKDSSAGVIVQLVIRVIDPEKATYEIEDYFNSSIRVIESYLRRMFSEYILDAAMQKQAKEDIIKEASDALEASLNAWGVKLVRIDITTFDLPKEVTETRNKILVASKEKEVSILDAEGEAEAVKIKAAAEAIAKKVIALGDGKAKWTRIQAIAEKLSLEPAQVIAYLLNEKMIDAMDTSTLVISTNKESNLNLPHIDMATSMAAVQNAIANKPPKE